MAGKLGRLPAVFTQRSVSSAVLMATTLNRLGSPPSASVDRVSCIPDFGMLGNDRYGCCVEADVGHTLMLRTGGAVMPTEADVLALYTAIAGFNPNDPTTDRGTNENAALIYLAVSGFLGHKLNNFGSIDIGNLNNMRWAVELFGHCRLGLLLPQSAMDQFDAGQPWDVVPNDGGIVGGHDVPIVRYDDNSFWVITWGKLQLVTAAFLNKYVEESHCELFFDWIQAVGRSPGGLDLNTLASDLNAL